MSYQTPPQFVGTPNTAPPRSEIDWGVIGEGFNILFKNWQTFIIPGLIILIALAPAVVIGYLPLIVAETSNASPEAAFGAMGLAFLLLAIGSLATALLYPGMTLFTINIVRGLPASTSDLWVGFRDPLGYFAVIILSGIVSMLGVLACCVGILFTSGLMMFVLPIKVATGCTATQAVSDSWNMLKKDWLMAGIFFFVVQLISQIGSYACYIGLVITLPFYYIAPAILYCRWVGLAPAPQQQSPVSPYPRGGASYGQQIGQEQPRPPEPESTPPKPEDL